MAKYNEQIAKLEEQRKRLEKEYLKERVKCTHKGKGGKLKVKQISNDGDVKCNICGEKFNLNGIEQMKLKEASELIHNAIQQVRVLTCTDDEQDKAKAAKFGEIDYNLRSLVEAYAKLSNNKGNDKQKKHKNDDVGYYDDSVSFIGGRR